MHPTLRAGNLSVRLMRGPMKLEWKRIETAPKDGTIIIIGYADDTKLRVDRRAWEAVWNERENAFTSTNGFIIHEQAAFWMPFPKPPENRIEGLLNRVEEIRNFAWQLEKGNDPRPVQIEIDSICSQIMLEIETKQVNFYGIA